MGGIWRSSLLAVRSWTRTATCHMPVSLFQIHASWCETFPNATKKCGMLVLGSHREVDARCLIPPTFRDDVFAIQGLLCGNSQKAAFTSILYTALLVNKGLWTKQPENVPLTSSKSFLVLNAIPFVSSVFSEFSSLWLCLTDLVKGFT